MTPEQAENQMWLTAVHEAGHAIIYREFDIPIKRIRAKWGLRKGFLGYVMLYRNTTTKMGVAVGSAMAGKIAENLVFGTRQTPNGGDLKHINRLLNGFSTKKRNEYKAWAARQVRKILKERAQELVNLAKHLKKHGRIDGTRQVDRIMARRPRK